MKNEQMQALDAAVVAGGGIVAFAKAMGVSMQAINGGWRKRGHVPLLRAQRIEALYGIPFRSLISDDLRAQLDAIKP